MSRQQTKDLDIHPDIIARGDDAVVRFLEMVARGTSPRFAEMLAMQQPPGIGITQATYIQDQNRWGRSILDRMNGDQRAVTRLKDNLAKHGYSLKSDDHYISTAARFAGDPEAIVNQHQSFSDLEKRVEERRKKAESGEKAEKDRCRLNPVIVERIRQRKIKENPDVARLDQKKVVADIIDKHGAKSKA